MKSATLQAGLSTPELAELLDLRAAASTLACVDEDKLAAIADQIRISPGFRTFSPATWDDPEFWNPEDDRQKRSQFFAVGNAINFRFWDLNQAMSGTIEGKDYRGAMYMWRALRRHRDTAGDEFFDAERWASLSESEFCNIFRDDQGTNPLAPGLQDRVENLMDLGASLARDWDGWFLNLVEASEGSLARFTELCRPLRAFDDPIFKLTMLNVILHSGSGIYRFRDEPLPAIDYHLVRHVLRQGVVRPSPELARKLRDAKLLTAAEGLELRRVALAAFVELSAQTGLSGEVLDNKFWLNRVHCTDGPPVCTDPATAHLCPFLHGCEQLVHFGRPLELTRYY